ncbi:GPN-loop GTPase 3 [Dermatophagoides pteronyssinus]|uniref:GPN-loop GTPase 3 n=1 Tax=Dermatophagoides pteronyssinus TaxID=6956 RepID=A0A6P6Y6H7_DERPT|nr:GPN-loop GTPase 3-like [Dermatophagoides pteronyssinus]
MPRYAQLVVGPAGSGKSTFIAAMMAHAEASKRTMYAVNLDPAAEVFNYNAIADIRQLIHVEDVMDDADLNFGPNGALVFAMEYLMNNLDWLTEKLGTQEDDYVLFDTPGQIELVSHFGLMKTFAKYLESLDFRVCVVFLLDSQFISDMSKYFSSLIISLITLINLELPMVNLLTKIDKLPDDQKKSLEDILEPSSDLVTNDQPCFQRNRNERFYRLSRAFAQIIDDYSLHKFLPISVLDEDLMNDVLLSIDNCIQWGEDNEVNVKDIDI